MTSSGPITINTYRISLSSGWNLFSIPANTSAASIPDVLRSIRTRIDNTTFILWYDASTTTWKDYRPSSSTGTFTHFEPGRAYWIRLNSSATLIGNYSTNYPTGNGTFPTATVAGNAWNMIGGWTTYNQTLSTSGALGSLYGALAPSNTVYKPSGSGYYINAYGDPLVPGQGFWAFITEDRDYTLQEP